MRTPSMLSLAMLALLGGVACSAATMAKPDATAGAAPVDTARTAAQDTTSAQNPSGYRGMERDTTAAPSDTTRAPGDTTLPGAAQQDSTSGMRTMDSTSGMGGMDTTRTDTSSTAR